MFEDWSHKKKNIVFLSGIGLVLVLGYFLAISKTIGLYQENTRFEQSNSNAVQLQRQLMTLSAEKRTIDSLLNTLDLEGGEQLLLRQLTKVSNPYKTPLTEYSEVQKRETRERFSLFEFEGGYRELVKLLFEVERRKFGGGVASVKFNVVTDRRSKESKLFMDLYFKIQ